jgi:1-acyl-sn-glycerol-3-phosphate acyltransferase
VQDSELLDETPAERWKRRALTGPALLTLTPLYLAALPTALAGAAVYDLSLGRRLTTTRFAAALGINLSMHVAALAGVFSAWLVGGRWAGADGRLEEELEQRMQSLWARATWAACGRVYGMNLEVEGAECATEGPVLLLPRHSSLIDTLLPLVLLSKEPGLRLRYVMKRELLWDPVLDALGHRWPTAFVRRGTRDPAELNKVVHLADGLGERDAIVLFPEGTRYSDEKRDHILETLRSADPERYEVARHLKNLLPPHPAGVLALLDAAPVDPVFVAHTGLEGANHFEDLLEGTLVGSLVRVKMWRVARSDIPEGPSERRAWLNEQWQKVDDWIETHRALSAETENAPK